MRGEDSGFEREGMAVLNEEGERKGSFHLLHIKKGGCAKLNWHTLVFIEISCGMFYFAAMKGIVGFNAVFTCCKPCASLVTSIVSPVGRNTVKVLSAFTRKSLLVLSAVS
jgi:hypothetical protein